MSGHRRIPKDPLGGHMRVYWSLLDSPAYIALSYSAKALFVDLRRKLNGTNNGNIEATMETLRHRGWRSHHTIGNALRELLAVGLIAQTRQGGIACMRKTCSLYRFTDVECYEHPKLDIPRIKPTYDYRRLETLGHAKAVLRDLANTRRTRSATNRKLQKLQQCSAEAANECHLVTAETASDPLSNRQKLQ